MVSCISVCIRTSYTHFSPFHIIVCTTDYGKKAASHPWVLASWPYVNVSFKHWTPVYLPSYEDAVLCCWVLQKTELSEMLKCGGEEICLQGKCIRQHFKICLVWWHCWFCLFFLSSDFIISITFLFYTGI